MAESVSQIQSDRQLVTFQIFDSVHRVSANLVHGRSPFYCALSASIIGSVSHPAGDRPSHPIWLVHRPGVGFRGSGDAWESAVFRAHDNEAIPLWTFLSLSISICVFAPLE